MSVTQPKTVAAAEHECCASCTAFRGSRPLTQAQSDSLARVGVDASAGVCRLNPVPVAKHATDWCRQFERGV